MFCEDKEEAFKKRWGWQLPSERRLYYLVQEEEDDSESEKEESELPVWLQDLSDIFVEPEGVIREDRTSYKIWVKEGAKAYQKALYRLFPEQTRVLHKELTGFKNKG